MSLPLTRSYSPLVPDSKQLAVGCITHVYASSKRRSNPPPDRNDWHKDSIAKKPIVSDVVISHQNPQWGREAKPDSLNVLCCASVMLFCPALVVVAWIALEHFDGSLFKALSSLYVALPSARSAARLTFDPTTINECFQSSYIWTSEHLPQPTWTATILYVGWLLFQAILYALLPAEIGYGQQTPAGHILPYKVNGLLSWAPSHALFIWGAWYARLWDPAVIAKNWVGLLVAANVYGYGLTVFAYAKAYLAPSHPTDQKFSGERSNFECIDSLGGFLLMFGLLGSWIYDLHFGIEMVCTRAPCSILSLLADLELTCAESSLGKVLGLQAIP